jgi:hypothetical protein
MKLYHFPSPNPQKVRFALLELGIACEIVPVHLTKGEHRTPEFLALNPLRPGSCAHRWHVDTLGIARDPGLPWGEDRQAVAPLGRRAGGRAALALLPVRAYLSTSDRAGV